MLKSILVAMIKNRGIRIFIQSILLCLILLTIQHYFETKKPWTIQDFGVEYNNVRTKRGMATLLESDSFQQLSHFDYKYKNLKKYDNRIDKYVTVRHGLIGGEIDHYWLKDSTILVVTFNYLTKRRNHCLVYDLENLKTSSCLDIPSDSANKIISTIISNP